MNIHILSCESVHILLPLAAWAVSEVHTEPKYIILLSFLYLNGKDNSFFARVLLREAGV
jgi:hypothetical protein